MLLRTVFKIDSSVCTNTGDFSLPYNAHLCYEASLNDEVELKSFLERLYSSSLRHSFFIGFNLNNSAHEQISATVFDFILPITFHYKYLHAESNTPIFGLTGNSSNQETIEFLNDLRVQCKSQGYTDIVMIGFPPGNRMLNHQTSTDLMEQVRLDYNSALLSAQSTTDTITICLSSLDDVPGMIDCLLEEEKVFSVSHPQQFNLLWNMSDLERKEKSLQIKYSILAHRLDSIQNYSSFHNPSVAESGKKTLKIMDFYENEYEILPLWYKRVGHIIKVIMGKRTFRSLFNDNVKKYKD